MHRQQLKEDANCLFYLKKYFAYVFYDLFDSNLTDSIDKYNFIKYINFSYVLGNRIFSIFDSMGKNSLCMYEFISAMSVIFYLKDHIKFYRFLFEIFDTNSDEKINKADVQFFYSHTFMKDFNDNKFVSDLFQNYDEMNFQQFMLKMTRTCELGKLFYNYFQNSIQFNINIYKLLAEIENENKQILENKISFQQECYDSDISEGVDDINLPNEVKNFPLFTLKNKFLDNSPKSIPDSTKLNLKLENRSNLDCTNISERKSDSTIHVVNNNDNYGNFWNHFISKLGFTFNFKNFLLKKNKKNFKEKFAGILYKDLILLKIKSDGTISAKIYHLAHSFLEKNGIQVIDGKIFYVFSIIFNSKKSTFYLENEKTYKKWIKKIKRAIDYKKISKKYEMIKLLGQGNYGKVVLALNKYTNEQVAIKVIKKKKNDNTFFLKELSLLNFCKFNKTVVKFIDNYEDPENFYLVMEFIKGSDLQTFLTKQERILNESVIKNIIKQVAEAIKYLHDNGIVHRDIKPENILIDEFGKVKICDFGFSEFCIPGEEINGSLGTLLYSAPEVLRHEKYNHKVDVWSLGIILYFLVTGCYPFETQSESKNSKKDVVRCIISKDFNYEIKLFCNYSINVFTILKKSLNRDIYIRYNISQFLADDWLEL